MHNNKCELINKQLNKKVGHDKAENQWQIIGGGGGAEDSKYLRE